MSTEQISLEDHKIKRNRAVVLTIVIMLLVTIMLWYFASAEETRHFQGICNVGVGRPYQNFIHQLRSLSETGNTKELERVIAAADTNSEDIYSVWLDGDYKAYRASITNILK